MQRGDDYFARGRVRQIAITDDGIIRATVVGTIPYRVTLIVDEDEDLLDATCECPWFAGNGLPCKHIWAVVRAASARNMLPDRPLSLELAEDLEDSTVVPFRRPDRRAPWERFLEALGPATPASPLPQRDVPDAIAYVIVPSRSHTHALMLQLLGRARRRNGEWGKWKPLSSLRLDDLHLLDPFDRESLALLHQRSYGDRVDPTVTIAPASTAWWIERLARAGRLAVRDENDALLPLTWDDGPPWTLRVAIVSDANRYRVEASLERDGESMPFERVKTTLPGILITDDRAARFDDGGRAAWLYALRASGPIEIPHADADRFRQALLRAPIGNISLPPELGWELGSEKPRPVLALMHDGWSTELHGELLFDYDEWRVSSRSHETQKMLGRKLIRRDRAFEERCRNRLAELRVIAVWDGFRVRAPQLEEVTRALTAEGWRIEIDSSPVRVTDDLDVEISSGIDWFDLDVHASFGDTRVALPELLAAAEAKRSLLRLADGSYGIVPSTLTDSLAPLLDLGKKHGDAVRFRASQALLIDALLQSKKARADEAFVDLRRRLASASPEPRQEPPTLHATLRPYQRAGLGWLHFLRATSLGGCLADDMGLGKTVQTLALLEGLRAEGNTRPSLVVAPRSLLFNWAAEAKRFAPDLRVLEHHGSEREKHSFDDYDVILTTYATMRLDVARLAEVEFEYVILDEAQAIKNASSQVAKASRLLRGKHRLALSGTPIENHLGELWSLFEFLNPGLLGSARSFSRTFASKTTPPERRDALARALRPLILRRTKEQVAPELPERIEQTLYCELEGKQRKQYDELRDHYREALLGRVKKSGMDRSRMQVLEALLRLRQAACHPALIDPRDTGSSAKLDLLMEELRDVLDSGHRALVFSQFTTFLGLVRRALEEDDVPHLYLDGKTQNRQSLVEDFQRADGPPLFLISLKAGGLGLNLTNADYIFLLDPWWNPAVEAQAIDRAHRIGRARPVVAHRLIARDTVEEKILELQARKRELAESIISEDNSVLRKLEVEDLELLLS
ncbi:MAG TPA: DEAD/DEAH box helicase [Thermoanaerobaculia bacterium]|nr:DEAD/DEAH box helicase [Thermoanaerobaculia bacterium]